MKYLLALLIALGFGVIIGATVAGNAASTSW